MPFPETWWRTIDRVVQGEHRADNKLGPLTYAIPGDFRHTARERLLLWRGKQLGALEHAQGLRDDDGFPIVPLDLAHDDPSSHEYVTLFPGG